MMWRLVFLDGGQLKEYVGQGSSLYNIMLEAQRYNCWDYNLIKAERRAQHV